MPKVSYIPLENILVDDALPRMSKKGEILIPEEFLISRGGCQFTVSDQFILASTAYELRSLVKHNFAAKHGSSKPLTSNELWLVELRIKSTRILAFIPDALRDMCKSSTASLCSHLFD